MGKGEKKLKGLSFKLPPFTYCLKKSLLSLSTVLLLYTICILVRDWNNRVQRSQNSVNQFFEMPWNNFHNTLEHDFMDIYEVRDDRSQIEMLAFQIWQNWLLCLRKALRRYDSDSNHNQMQCPITGYCMYWGAWFFLCRCTANFSSAERETQTQHGNVR